MKLAILGTGLIVRTVLPVLEEIEGIELVSILSTPRSIAIGEELAQTYSIAQATSSFDDILSNPEIDTVYVALPNHLHFDYAKKALQSGKHVICEKPFTMTFAEFEDLAAIAKEKNLILLEAITNQYRANFQFVKDNLQKLGDIKIVECNFSKYSSRYDAFLRGEIAPAFDPAQGGGALRDLNIYNIHFVVGLFGQPERVQYLANMENSIDTSGMLTMDYGTFKVVCIAAKDSNSEVNSTIQGVKGILSINGSISTVPEVAITLNGQDSEITDLNTEKHNMYDEFVAFEAIIAKRDFDSAKSALEHSHLVMKVLDEAVASI